jgi:hypothetical protein
MTNFADPCVWAVRPAASEEEDGEARTASEQGKRPSRNFFIPNGCNPLKSPDFKK